MAAESADVVVVACGGECDVGGAGRDAAADWIAGAA